jgi:lipopolysaccharide export LptBFGC system permease protein LptF
LSTTGQKKSKVKPGILRMKVIGDRSFIMTVAFSFLFLFIFGGEQLGKQAPGFPKDGELSFNKALDLVI